MRATVLPALHYGHVAIVEARLDQALASVERLSPRDLAWLRANQPQQTQQIAEKAVRLGGQLRLLATAIGPEMVSIEDTEEEAAA